MRTPLLAAALLTLAAGPALAAGAPSGSVLIRGKVDASCSIGVTDLRQSLNLTGGESNKVVGTMVEDCNSPTGYTVSLSSANAGVLKAATGTGSIAYTVGYDGTTGGLASQMQVSRQTAQFAKNAALSVSLTAAPKAIAGDYSDTITLTIAAK